MRFMAFKNTVIPNENLSSRERVYRKIRSFDGRPFTLKDIHKLLRPRMSIDAIRFHVENLVNNLLIEKLPRVARQPQLYVERDLLKYIFWDENNGAAYEYLMELYRMVNHLKSGRVVTIDTLKDIRREIGVRAVLLKEELNSLQQLHDCTDLWNPTTLVNRLGFNDVEENEK